MKNENEILRQENDNKKYKSGKNHWEIVLIVLLFCFFLILTLFGFSSNDFKESIENTTKTTLQINNRNLQRAKTSVIGNGNQYLSDTYFIPLKVQGVEQVTIEGKTATYAYVSFPPSFIPSGSILGYFNSSPQTQDCIKWVNTQGTYYQLQVVINNEVMAFNTYYSGQMGSDYRWYITEFNFIAINTPYFSNYQGDVETPYYDAFFSVLSQVNSPMKFDLLNIVSIQNYYSNLSSITNLNSRVINTWQYYQLATNNEFYQQGYDVGYGKGNDDGISQGVTVGQNDVLTNPNSFGLYTPSQYEDYGNTKFNEGKASLPTTADKDGFKWLMGSVLNAPYNIISGMLNFEIFGINLFSLCSFVFTAVLIMFIIKLILSR